MSYNHEMDGADAVAHWRDRHDRVKARSNEQFEELEAVRWERDELAREIERLKEQLAGTRSMLTGMTAERDEAKRSLLIAEAMRER